MSFLITPVINWAEEKATGYLRTGIQAGGSLAGNAVGGVGSLIESSGRAVGEGTVAGGIRGVGNYINGYGQKIQGSMASDGPVSGGKTAVKPQGAQKALPSSGGVQKALPSSGGKPKAPSSAAGGVANRSKSLPAPGPKAGGLPRSAAQAPKSGAGPKLSNGAPKTAPNGKIRINPDSRPKPTGTGITPKPNSSAALGPKPTAKPTPDGKVRISAASRPKPAAKR